MNIKKSDKNEKFINSFLFTSEKLMEKLNLNKYLNNDELIEVYPKLLDELKRRGIISSINKIRTKYRMRGEFRKSNNFIFRY